MYLIDPLITEARPYQSKCINNAKFQWFIGNKNVLIVAATGAGKTLIKSFIAKEFYERGESVVIFAHRDVLISQISLALCKVGIPHDFICSASTKREIGNLHVDEFGRSYISDRSSVVVASVLTWINRDTSLIAPMVKCWLMDEAHHLIKETSWEKCVRELTNSVGVGVTATPLRADNKVLGRDHHGIFDTMVLAPTMGELIEMGYLSPYRIYTVPSNIDLSTVNVTGSGDYNQKKLAAVTTNANITGDAVEHYKKYGCHGKAITFCVTIEHAKLVAKEFNDAGIRSVALSSKSKMAHRQKTIRDFRKGIIRNLVNVDLFGEGFDVPDCTVVIMLRKTMSYGLFKQQFGRMLRVFEGKEYGVLLDHVGNVHEHCIYGEPHDDPDWSLEPPKKNKKKNDGVEREMLSRTCPKCFGFYVPKANTPLHYVCPYCGHAETEAEIIDAAKDYQAREGNLVEHSSDYINELINRKNEIDAPVEMVRQKHSYSPVIVRNSASKNHLERQEAQRLLRDWISAWCEREAVTKGLDIKTTQAQFEMVFGVNVFRAQTLGKREATELSNKINNKWYEKY